MKLAKPKKRTIKEMADIIYPFGAQRSYSNIKSQYNYAGTQTAVNIANQDGINDVVNNQKQINSIDTGNFLYDKFNEHGKVICKTSSYKKTGAK